MILFTNQNAGILFLSIEIIPPLVFTPVHVGFIRSEINDEFERKSISIDFQHEEINSGFGRILISTDFQRDEISMGFIGK